MTLEVLVSCMHQTDISIIKRSNIQSDVLVINQHDVNDYQEYEFTNKRGEVCKARIISTTERGLSKSRNMAIAKSVGDICMICDDDEFFYSNSSELINEAYEKYNKADLIAFKFEYNKIYPNRPKRIGYLSALKIASWQLSFRRSSIVKNHIRFDETIGSGVTKAGGEEVLFMYDCLKKGLKIYYVPICLGQVGQSTSETSQWFNGYNNEYFYDRGAFTRKLLGKTGAVIYMMYFAIAKHRLYSKNVSFSKAIINMYRGIFSI